MQTVAVTPRGYTPPNPTAPAIQNESAYVYQPQNNSKKKLFSQLLVTMVVGGVIGSAIALGVVVAQNGGVVALWNKTFPSGKVAKAPFYFLADSAFEDVDKANLRIERLRSQGYKDAGIFKIPDYPNLGNSLFQQVYTGQFQDIDSCIFRLKEHSKYVSDAYCAFASPDAKAAVQRVFGSEVATSPSPTPSSKPSITPSVTPTATVTPTPTKSPDKPSPEIAIRDYYSLINDRQFQTAWQNLTPTFQRDRAGGYNTFTEWWRTVDQVSVNSARLVESKGNSAIVDINLTYQQGKKISPETLRMYLVWNESTQQWQISATN